MEFFGLILWGLFVRNVLWVSWICSLGFFALLTGFLGFALWISWICSLGFLVLLSGFLGFAHWVSLLCSLGFLDVLSGFLGFVLWVSWFCCLGFLALLSGFLCVEVMFKMVDSKVTRVPMDNRFYPRKTPSLIDDPEQPGVKNIIQSIYRVIKSPRKLIGSEIVNMGGIELFHIFVFL